MGQEHDESLRTTARSRAEIARRSECALNFKKVETPESALNQCATGIEELVDEYQHPHEHEDEASDEPPA